MHNRDFRKFLSRVTCRKLFKMNRAVHGHSKLFRRKRINNTKRNHLFRNNRDFNQVLRNVTSNKLFLMNLIKHGHSKHFTVRK